MKNKEGVSAVVGVILMVAIVVAIACTVYFIASNTDNEIDIEESKDVKVQQPKYELVEKEIINGSLNLAIRFNTEERGTSYRIFLVYYKVIQENPFTEEKESIFIATENLYVKNPYLGCSVYVLQANFELNFSEYNTNEFLCKIEYYRGTYWYGLIGKDTVHIYK